MGSMDTVVKKTDTPKETSGHGQTGGIAAPTAKRTAKKSAPKVG